MTTEVRIPDISEGVTEGTVISLLVAVGDDVELDQSLLELETDKAIVAIPSPAAGKVASIEVAEGDSVAVGAVILKLEAGAMAAATSGAEAGDAQVEPSSPEKVVEEAAPPDAATADAAVAATAASAPIQPTPDAVTATAGMPPDSPAPDPAESGPIADVAPAAPSVRRLARELGVDINVVPGNGPHGRISAEDVREFVKQTMTTSGSGGTYIATGAPASDRKTTAGTTRAGSIPGADDLPDFTRWGGVIREPLHKVREITAAAMSHAWHTVPQVTQYDEADITEVEEFRRAHNQKLGDRETKLTMTAILLKFAAVALQEFPQFNASLDWPRRELVMKQYIHIGVAVDTDHGLLVPVIRDIDQKGIEQLATELTEIAARARERRVNPAELEGGNFTISNLGGIGGRAFSPIVYPPQVAILGVSRARTEPVWHNNEFRPRLIMPLSLTYDHRVIDGADGARFLSWLCEALKQPLLLAMKG